EVIRHRAVIHLPALAGPGEQGVLRQRADARPRHCSRVQRQLAVVPAHPLAVGVTAGEHRFVQRGDDPGEVLRAAVGIDRVIRAVRRPVHQAQVVVRIQGEAELSGQAL
ncbi:MAG TPA: hypothetical protein VLH85_01790, partial [Levilinea sp.]|nr:hypothetical protein [Levilinea sp.]